MGVIFVFFDLVKEKQSLMNKKLSIAICDFYFYRIGKIAREENNSFW